jgi:hypothetical protein
LTRVIADVRRDTAILGTFLSTDIDLPGKLNQPKVKSTKIKLRKQKGGPEESPFS